MTGLPEPEPGYRWVLQVPDQPRRRSPWPWVISISVVVVLIAGAWFAGEWLARDIIERAVRVEVVDSLGASEVDVEVVGPVLPQVIAGSLDDVRVEARDVSHDAFSGDVAIRAESVPIRGDDPIGSAHATVRMTLEQVRALLGEVDGFPVDTVGLERDEVTMSIDLTVFGAQVPIGVGLSLGADEGRITLTPARFQVADAEIDADTLRERFGPLADLPLSTWRVCVADDLPAGFTLTDARVDSDVLEADLDIDGDILHDPQLQQPGTCA